MVAKGPFSSDTWGLLNVPCTLIGVRTLSGLKSLGTTTARRSSASVASDKEPSIHTAESAVSTTITLGRKLPSLATRSATAHCTGRASSPLTSMPRPWAMSSPASSIARCDTVPLRKVVRAVPCRLAKICAVERPCPASRASPCNWPDTYGGAPLARVILSQRSSRTASQRRLAVHSAVCARPSSATSPRNWPWAVRANRSCRRSTPPCSSRCTDKGCKGSR